MIRSSNSMNLYQSLCLAVATVALAIAAMLSPNLLAAQTDLPLTPPNAPTITAVTPQVHSLDVFWEPPAVDANNAPTHYIVDWHPGYQSNPIAYPYVANSLRIPNLVAGTTYTLRIIAVNDAGKSYSAPVEGVPISGPAVTFAQVDESTIDQTTADVNVTLENPDSQSLTVYLRHRTAPESETDFVPWIDAAATTTTGATVAFSLTGLTPSSLYEVQATLDQFFHQGVAEDGFFTPGPPEKPNLTLVPGDGTLTAQWSVFLYGGSVQSYLLEWKRSSEVAFTNSVNPAVSDSTFEITSLTNGEQYDARLTVVTDLGSATSDVVSVVPAMKPVVSKIELVELIDNRSIEAYTSINLHTAAESTTILVRILVRFGPPSGPYAFPVPLDEPTNTRTSRTLLDSSGEYVFQAVLVQGDEEPNWDESPQLMVRTEPGTPWATDPAKLVHGDGEITVEWEKPSYDGGAPITAYSVFWRVASQSVDASRNARVGPNSRTYTITGLQNGVDYRVVVQPFNESGGSVTVRSNRITPSTVPQSAPTEINATTCSRWVVVGWVDAMQSGGSPITDYIVQWRSGDQEYGAAERKKSVGGRFSNTAVQGLDTGTKYWLRVRAVNMNGPAYRLVTNPVDGTIKTVPIWSEEFTVVPRDGICIIGARFGNILADSIPMEARFLDVDEATDVFVRHRERGASRWLQTQHREAQPGQTSLKFDLIGLKPDTHYDIEISSERSFPRHDVWKTSARTLPAPDSVFSFGARARILRIEPAISAVSVSSGDTIDLAVNIFGRQNILENELADPSPDEGGPAFVWQSSPAITFVETDVGADRLNGVADDREVRITAPDTPGTYDITVDFANPNMCLGTRPDETESERDARCSATFQLTVRQSSVINLFEPPPVNPAGAVPETLTDAAGRAYAVFTPVEGGLFTGEGTEFSAGPGVVESNELIGVSVKRVGEASNAGQTHHRYTLAGHRYTVDVVDADGVPVSHYLLNQAATICLPLPVEIRSRIDNLVIIAADTAGSPTLLTTNARITPTGVLACGHISQLPATVAVGALGSPQPMPTATLEPPAENLPETGAVTVEPLAVALALILGASLVAASVSGVLIAARIGPQR